MSPSNRRLRRRAKRNIPSTVRTVNGPYEIESGTPWTWHNDSEYVTYIALPVGTEREQVKVYAPNGDEILFEEDHPDPQYDDYENHIYWNESSDPNFPPEITLLLWRWWDWDNERYELSPLAQWVGLQVDSYGDPIYGTASVTIAIYGR